MEQKASSFPLTREGMPIKIRIKVGRHYKQLCYLPTKKILSCIVYTVICTKARHTLQSGARLKISMWKIKIDKMQLVSPVKKVQNYVSSLFKSTNENKNLFTTKVFDVNFLSSSWTHKTVPFVIGLSCCTLFHNYVVCTSWALNHNHMFMRESCEKLFHVQ